MRELWSWCILHGKADAEDTAVRSGMTIRERGWKVGGELPGESVDLVIGSPPYNTGVVYPSGYRDRRGVGEMEGWLRKQMAEFYRILRPGRYVCVSVPVVSVMDGHVVCWWDMITTMMREVGFQPEIPPIVVTLGDGVGCLAEKALGDGYSARLGCRIACDLVICGWKRGTPEGRRIEATAEQWEVWGRNVWIIEPDMTNDVRAVNPAAWPRELAYRVVLMTTSVGDVVVDPWCGSGRTAAALMGGPEHVDHPMGARLFVGVDLRGQIVRTVELLKEDWKMRRQPWSVDRESSV